MGVKPTVNLSVPSDMKQWLEEKATQGETNVSSIVRAIIREKMNEERSA